MKKKVVLQDDPEEPAVPHIILTQAILEMSRSMKRLLASGLNRKAIVILVHDQSKLSKRDIELVLNNLESLAEDYT